MCEECEEVEPLTVAYFGKATRYGWRRPGRRLTGLTWLTLTEARDGLRKKDFSAAELADAHLFAMEQARSLNAYVLETPDRASAMAKRADARIAKGDAGRLEGIPLAI